MSGDYRAGLAAAKRAKEWHWSSEAFFHSLDYYYYAALTVAACYENASANEQQEWRELLTAHKEQLCKWADSYPPTFADKHALVAAEIARIDGRPCGSPMDRDPLLRMPASPSTSKPPIGIRAERASGTTAKVMSASILRPMVP